MINFKKNYPNKDSDSSFLWFSNEIVYCYYFNLKAKKNHWDFYLKYDSEQSSV